MKNILIVSTNKNITNGASACIINNAVGLRKRGFNVVVLTPKGALSSLLEEKGFVCEYMIPFVSIWKKPLKLRAKDRKKLFIARCYYSLIYLDGIFDLAKNVALKYTNKKMEEVIKKHKIDLVHINAITSGFQSIVPKKMNIPLVWHIREFLEEDLESTFVSQEYADKLFNNATCFISISDAIKKKYERRIKKPIVTIYDGIEVEKFYFEKEIVVSKFPKIIIVGRIIKGKGQDILIRSIKSLIDAGIRVYCDMYGSVDDIDYLNEIEEYIAKNKLGEYVKYQGFCDNIENKIREYDIMAVCSKKEGFGLATVQGMLSGLIVVAPNTGANKELIEDGKTGLHFSYKKGSEDLANKLKFIIENQEKSREIAKAGQKFAKTLDIENSVDRIKKLYDFILKKEN